ncbi:regucalcin-like isoform X2 [Plodia interpunctella]|uniref:regucalcin-like isoform X2 n=1 Tax=Plodia interpunctella TaxID=58824 RepID=UPI002368247D|nr:regucalcin-like isoform X2 [Plodia interpunctella]
MSLMSHKVTKITEPVVLGEGPHWDERVQALYFVSIHEQTIHKYVPATKEHTRTKLNGRVGFIVPVEGRTDQFVVGVELKFLLVQWDGKNNSEAKLLKELCEVDQQTKNRLNDGKADPRGRLYAGTMGHEEPPGVFVQEAGSLFVLERASARARTLAARVGISNGLAWDERNRAMYYVDSMDKHIRKYDWDPDTGNISNMTYVFDFVKNGIAGVGDGGTIDTDGNLWWCVFDGSCVLQIDPNTGKVLRKIDIPAKQVTSCTFGGPNFDTLFVTTASMTIGEEQKPPCGSCFMVTGLGVKGYPNVNVKL